MPSTPQLHAGASSLMRYALGKKGGKDGVRSVILSFSMFEFLKNRNFNQFPTISLIVVEK